MNTPFLIHDAEVALFPAWEDGMPMQGPAPLRDAVAPYFHCHTAIRWSRSVARKESSFGDRRRAGGFRPDEISISISHPEGVVLDPVGHAYRMPSLQGRYCIVVVFWSQEDNQWQRWQFFHVRIVNDSLDAGDGSDAAARPLEFMAEHVEFDTYAGAPPNCVPQVLGRVDFFCGPLHVPCMTYDMFTNEWRMTTHSDTGIRHTVGEDETNVPYLMWDEQEVSDPVTLPEGLETSTFSLMQPRTQYREPGAASHGGIAPSPYLGVLWQQRLFFSLQRAIVPVAATGAITRNSSPVVNSFLNLAGVSLQFWDGSFLDLPGVLRVVSPYSAEDIAYSINNGDGHTEDGANGPHPTVSATWEGNVVTLTARTAGAAGNSLAIGTNAAFSRSGSTLSGGSDGAPGEKNNLLLHHGITLEVNGSPEPIEHMEQDQVLHESVAVFRVLDRVYATVGHDRVCVPAIFHGLTPVTPNIFFKFGDTILDDRGWWNLAEPVLSVTGPSYP